LKSRIVWWLCSTWAGSSTHDGGPLADGQLVGFTIACPRHGAQFDIRTGRVLSMPATRDTVAHEVKVEGDQVLVRVRGD